MTEDDIVDALRRAPTEDELEFGRRRWIYCNQHGRPHMTGWCTVGNRDKILLEALTQDSVYDECWHRGLNIYKG